MKCIVYVWFYFSTVYFAFVCDHYNRISSKCVNWILWKWLIKLIIASKIKVRIWSYSNLALRRTIGSLVDYSAFIVYVYLVQNKFHFHIQKRNIIMKIFDLHFYFISLAEWIFFQWISWIIQIFFNNEDAIILLSIIIERSAKICYVLNTS